MLATSCRGKPETEAPLRYTRTAMALHWLIALMIICNVLLGLFGESFPDGWVRPAIDTHKSIGITVLGLVILRILWRLSHKPPPLPRTFPKWEHVAAHVAHFLLYLLMIGLPLSGWLHDSAWKAAATHPMHLYGFIPWPRIGYVMNLDPHAERIAARPFWRAAYLAGLCAVCIVRHARGRRAEASMDRQEVSHHAHGAVTMLTLVKPQPEPTLKTSLEAALALASPRIAPRPFRLPSVLIHGGVLLLWLVLFARAFFLHGVVAWSTGIAYVVYDTLVAGVRGGEIVDAGACAQAARSHAG